MLTLGEFIRDQFPYYLNMGVSYDEYWHGDHTRLKYYRQAKTIKTKEMNTQAWLQGMYIHYAIVSVLPKSETTYPSEPFPIDDKDIQDQEERQKRKEIENARAYMEAVMQTVNKQRRQKEAEKDG